MCSLNCGWNSCYRRIQHERVSASTHLRPSILIDHLKTSSVTPCDSHEPVLVSRNRGHVVRPRDLRKLGNRKIALLHLDSQLILIRSYVKEFCIRSHRGYRRSTSRERKDDCLKQRCGYTVIAPTYCIDLLVNVQCNLTGARTVADI